MTNKKDKTLSIVLGIFALVIVTTAASFAFFTYSRTGETTTTIIAGDVEFSYTEGSSVGLSNEFPVSDETGAADPNNEYTFTVKMASTSSTNVMNYNVYLVDGNDASGVNYFTNDQIKFALLKNDVYVAGTSSSTGKKLSEIDGFEQGTSEGEGIVLSDQEILPGVTDSYKLRIWISKDVDYSNTINGQDDKTSAGKYNGYKYSLKVKVTAGIGESSLNVQSPTVSNLTMTTTVSDPNGLSAYAVTESSTAPASDSDEWISLTDGTAFNSTEKSKNIVRLSTVTSKTITFMVKKNGTYYLHVKNTLGQTSSKVFTANATGEKATTKIVNLAETNTNELRVDEHGVTDNRDFATKEYRYYGETPKNYVWFNNELWRIIGAMDVDDGSAGTDTTGTVEKRLKIIRNKSLGKLQWDFSEENDGHGVNEWSQSDLMNLLNSGAYYNRTKGTCYTGYGSSSECDFTSTGLRSEAKAMIGNAKWYLGAHTETALTSQLLYTHERGTYTGKSACSSTTGGCSDTIERKKTWVGEVGLMYPSDYGYSAMSSCVYTNINEYKNSCNDTSWLDNSGVDQWTITPRAFSNSASMLYYLAYDGVFATIYADYPVEATPVVYLNENVKILDGDGSEDKPFVLSN